MISVAHTIVQHEPNLILMGYYKEVHLVGHVFSRTLNGPMDKSVACIQ